MNNARYQKGTGRGVGKQIEQLWAFLKVKEELSLLPTETLRLAEWVAFMSEQALGGCAA
jgi:hypothetical protein